MKTISEGILSSNGAGIKVLVDKWYNELPVFQRKNFKVDDKDSTKYYYIANTLTIDKDFDNNFPSWVVFDFIKTVVLDFPDLSSVERWPKECDKLFVYRWKNGSVDIPIKCSSLEINDCKLFNILIYKQGELNTLTIRDCPKFSDLSSLPREVKEIVLENDSNIISLEGLPEDVESITIDKCGITSLIGLPKHIKGDLVVTGCKSLKYLDGIPESVKGLLMLMRNETEFNKEYIKDRCKCNNIKCK